MTRMRAFGAWVLTQEHIETTEVLLILALVAIVYGVDGLWGGYVASLIAGGIVMVYAWPPRTVPPSVPAADRKVS
jgi:hypothetical protein